MKNFKFVYRLLLVLPLALMVGCIAGSDDINDVFTVTSTTLENSVFIETDDTHEEAHVAPANVAQTITVGVNNAIETDIVVSFNVTKDGAPAVEGVDYAGADATIAGSENFGSTQFTFFGQGRYEVTIASSTGPSLEIVGNKAIFLVPSPITFTITWDDAFFDYDIFLVTGNQDFYGTVIAFSNGVTNFETFEATPPEGFSSFYIQDFWGDNAGTPVELTVEIDGEISTYDVIMDISKWVLVIETSVGEDGFPVYDITHLD